MCAAQDQCHSAGACDPASGTCSNPAKADGTACDNGNICTLADTCQAGTCTAGSQSPACNLPPGLTEAQIAAARAAGLLPAAGLVPTFYEPVGNAAYNTVAIAINNAGVVAGNDAAVALNAAH